MDMFPSVLPDKLPLERVAVYLQLETSIGTDTITGTPAFTSDPLGLVFETVTLLDSDRTVAALVSGGSVGTTYVVSALCVLASGETVQPTVALPVIAPVSETLQRRPIVL